MPISSSPQISFIQKYPRTTAFLFGCVLCAGIIILAETILGFCVPNKRDSLFRYYPENYRHRNEYGLHRPNPGKHRSYHQIKSSQKMIYDVEYTIDAFNRRFTPVSLKGQHHQFIAFLGCSFTYGEGVADNQTLPARAGSYAHEYVPYNYGFHGWGPSDVLVKVETTDFKKEIPEDDGIFVYTFIDDHVHRALGTMSVMRWYRKGAYYKKIKNGELVKMGDFYTERPVLTRIYSFLSKSNILRVLKVDLPIIWDRDIEFTVNVIAKIRDTLKKQYPQSLFYVLIHPYCEKYRNKVKLFCAKYHLPYLDYQYPSKDARFYLSNEDKHPSAYSHDFVAQRLVQDLQLK